MSSTIPAFTSELNATGNCIHRGMPWTLTLNWEDARGATFDLTGASALCTLTSDDGGTIVLATPAVQLAAVEPNITLALTDAETTALDVIDTSYLWLTLTDSAGRDNALLYGPCPVNTWGAP
jgi:hypothetical protein